MKTPLPYLERYKYLVSFRKIDIKLGNIQLRTIKLVNQVFNRALLQQKIVATLKYSDQ